MSEETTTSNGIYQVLDASLDTTYLVDCNDFEKVILRQYHDSSRRTAHQAPELRIKRELAVLDATQDSDLFSNYLGRGISSIIVVQGQWGPSVFDTFYKKTPSTEEVAELGGDLCTSLQYLHERGIILRNADRRTIIKGDTWRFSSLDTARISGLFEHEDPRDVYGTPAFTPPEQIHGSPFEPRSDVYSLGALLYWVVVGSDSFRGSPPSGLDIYDEICSSNRTLLSPEEVNAVDPKLSDVIMKAMEQDPTDRYGSAKEFATALRLS
jgi:serine/threonine protein kinase